MAGPCEPGRVGLQPLRARSRRRHAPRPRRHRLPCRPRPRPARPCRVAAPRRARRARVPPLAGRLWSQNMHLLPGSGARGARHGAVPRAWENQASPQGPRPATPAASPQRPERGAPHCRRSPPAHAAGRGRGAVRLGAPRGPVTARAHRPGQRCGGAHRQRGELVRAGALHGARGARGARRLLRAGIGVDQRDASQWTSLACRPARPETRRAGRRASASMSSSAAGCLRTSRVARHASCSLRPLI